MDMNQAETYIKSIDEIKNDLPFKTQNAKMTLSVIQSYYHGGFQLINTDEQRVKLIIETLRLHGWIDHDISKDSD